MRQVLRYVALLTLLMNFLTLPAGALTPLPPTVSKGVAPNWTPAPGSPGVEYAPNLKVDLFRYQGTYYYWVAGGWPGFAETMDDVLKVALKKTDHGKRRKPSQSKRPSKKRK